MNEGAQRAKRTLRQHCDRRFGALQAARQALDPVYYEIATLAQPARSRFLRQGSNRSNTRAKAHRLYDGHAIRAFRILRSGMTSGMSSPSRPWLKLKLPDPDLMKFHQVQTWLGDVERIIYAFLAKTNFYTAVKTGYAELGLFGTESIFMDEHWQKGLVFHTMTAGEYYLGAGDDGTTDTLVRHVPLSVHQIIERFVADRFDKNTLHWDRVSAGIRQAWEGSNDDQVFEIMHLVEPNPDYDPLRSDAKGKLYRSLYWEMGPDAKDKEPLRLEGYEEKPFIGARWETTGSDVYGSGPGWDGLADMRQLQVQAKRMGDITDMGAMPPTIGPAGVKVKMVPRAHTVAAAVDMAQVKPLYEINPQWLGVVEKDLERLYGKIDEAAYVDIFMAITSMDGVQPRNVEEIFARNEEKMTQLGPAVESVGTEKLTPIIDRVFAILQRRGALPDAPEEIHGMPLTVEFISTLAQAQRMVGLSQTERVIGFVGGLAGAFPEAADNINADEAVRDYAERAGVSPKILNSVDDIEAMRKARQQQQMQEQAAAMMPAVKDGADAAQLLANAPVNQGQSSLLDSLVNASQAA